MDCYFCKSPMENFFSENGYDSYECQNDKCFIKHELGLLNRHIVSYDNGSPVYIKLEFYEQNFSIFSYRDLESSNLDATGIIPYGKSPIAINQFEFDIDKLIKISKRIMNLKVFI